MSNFILLAKGFLDFVNCHIKVSFHGIYFYQDEAK